MNCSKCPHKEDVEEALAPCQICEHAHLFDHGDIKNCKKCKSLVRIKAALRPCERCDAGVLMHTYHFDDDTENKGLAALIKEIGKPVDCFAQTEGVTKLAPEVEDALRIVLARIVEFRPIELLLLQHVMHKRSLASFGEPMKKLHEQLNTRYDFDNKSFRATTSHLHKRIVEKEPALEPLFEEVIKDTTGRSI